MIGLLRLKLNKVIIVHLRTNKKESKLRKTRKVLRPQQSPLSSVALALRRLINYVIFQF